MCDGKRKAHFGKLNASLLQSFGSALARVALQMYEMSGGCSFHKIL
jgi:hypothetical protein